MESCRARRIIICALLLAVSLGHAAQGQAQYNAEKVGIEFSSWRTYWVGGFGPNVSIGLGKNEIFGGFHWIANSVRGTSLGYRRLAFCMWPRTRPFFEGSLGYTRARTALGTYPANCFGVMVGIGARYAFFDYLALTMVAGVSYNRLEGQAPYPASFGQMTSYTGLGLRLALPAKWTGTDPETAGNPQDKGFGFEVGLRIRVMPVLRSSLPRSNFSTLMGTMTFNLGGRISPVLYLQAGREYDQNWTPHGAQLHGFGGGVRLQMAEKGTLGWHLVGAGFVMPWLDAPLGGQRVWVANGIDWALQSRLGITAETGLSFSKYFTTVDLMGGITYQLFKASNKQVDSPD